MVLKKGSAEMMKQESGLMMKDGYGLKVPVVEIVQKLRGWLVTIDGENDLFFYRKSEAEKHKSNLEIQFAHQKGAFHGE